MTNRGFLARHGIVRNAIRADMLYFAIPGLIVFIAGLIVSGQDGYDGLTATLWHLAWHPREALLLPANKIVGLAMFIIGLTVAIVAAHTLKRFYSSTLVTKQGHELVTHGIYRFVRHPIYFGVLLILLGAVPVYAASLNGFLVMSLLIPILLNRIRMEERLLTEEFGDSYLAYKESTRKLIPFVY